MSDNLKAKTPQDSSRINIHESWEIQYWTKELGVSKADLEAAVKSVGVSAEKVRSWLKNIK